jgi:hypothetical protein
VGCWHEAVGKRALTGAMYAYAGMTLESCAQNCTGFAFWGAEYGQECFCGNTVDPTTAAAPLTDCDMTCSGNPTQYCGAGNRLELYSNGPVPGTTTAATTTTTSAAGTSAAGTTATTSSAAPSSTVPTAPGTVGKFTFVGCQTEATGIRALSAVQLYDPNMTNEMCAAFCSAYTYFGTEYSQECEFGLTSA